MKIAQQNGSKDMLCASTTIRNSATPITNCSIKLMGILLAGGASTRMKTDKALLDWQGLKLIDHQLRTLDNVVGRYNGRTLVSGKREGYDHLLDLTPGGGPLFGIESAFTHLNVAKNRGAILLVLPIDMPFVTVALLDHIVQNLIKTPLAQACYYSGFEMPFALRINQKSSSALAQSLKSACNSEHSIRSFLSKLKRIPLELEEKEKEQFLNLNTREQYIHEANYYSRSPLYY